MNRNSLIYSAGLLLSLFVVGCNGWGGADADKVVVLPNLEPIEHGFKVEQGRLELYLDFPSAHFASRNISVWLPNDYDGSEPYEVLYMHDGQMLFDASATWNKQEWGVDEIAQQLIDQDRVRPFIVVGVWNRSQARFSEYMPQKPYESLPTSFVDSVLALSRAQNRVVYPIRSDDYLRYLVEDVKPFIEARYNVLQGPEHTFLAGSSMGGLISMYAQCEYPEVFGAAACLSTHWPGMYTNENNPIPDAFVNYLDQKMTASTAANRWYFDYGDKTLDSLYPPHQARVDSLMAAKGFSEQNWITEFYPGANHSEDAWKARLHRPFLFMLGK